MQKKVAALLSKHRGAMFRVGLGLRLDIKPVFHSLVASKYHP